MGPETIEDKPAISSFRSVYGVDFSGAEDAGRKIWVATGTIEGRTLRIEQCQPGEALPRFLQLLKTVYECANYQIVS